MYIDRGQTRIVFVFEKFVIKIPNFLNGWKFILLGILANLSEKTWSGHSTRLCPVIFTFPFGFFSIMHRAWDIGNVQFPEDYFKGLPYDPSENNFGLYKGKPVLIDYGEWIKESFLCPKCGKWWDEVI